MYLISKPNKNFLYLLSWQELDVSIDTVVMFVHTWGTRWVQNAPFWSRWPSRTVHRVVATAAVSHPWTAVLSSCWKKKQSVIIPAASLQGFRRTAGRSLVFSNDWRKEKRVSDLKSKSRRWSYIELRNYGVSERVGNCEKASHYLAVGAQHDDCPLPDMSANIGILCSQ